MRTRALVLSTAAIVAVAACTAATDSSGGVSPTHAARSATSAKITDWTTYHGGGGRAGYDGRMPAAKGTPRIRATLRLDGAVYASPLVVDGRTIVATENDTVYAFNAKNHKVWSRHLAAPEPQNQLPCGNIDPLGITGTPVYDRRTGLIYVAAETSGAHHTLFALRAKNGTVAFHRSLDLAGVDRHAMQERGALALANGRVYVPFGGLAGDCADYKGRVVGYAAGGKGRPVSYTVPTAREAGMWTPPGPTVDGSGHLFVSAGNGASGPGDKYDYSDSVTELGPSLHRLQIFSPRTWATDNQADLDLGSQGPALDGKWIFIAGKSGTAYVLRKSHLGGIGGAVSSSLLCTSFGGTAVHAGVVYVPCTDGVRAVRIDSHGRLHVLWHADSGVVGSPVIGGNRVWSVAGDTLYGLSLKTGRTLEQVRTGDTNRFATPALSGRRVLVGTLTGLTVVRTS